MSGFEVCQTMKADPRLRDVPIIFITSPDSASALDSISEAIPRLAPGLTHA